MGFRFRKSKKVGPLRINFSKSGIGWSVGAPGIRYTKRADGRSQVTTGIPGTGISYQSTVSGKPRKGDSVIKQYKNERQMNEDIGVMEREGWNYVKHAIVKPKPGCMRILLLNVFAWVFPPNPVYLVEYRKK